MSQTTSTMIKNQVKLPKTYAWEEPVEVWERLDDLSQQIEEQLREVVKLHDENLKLHDENHELNNNMKFLVEEHLEVMEENAKLKEQLKNTPGWCDEHEQLLYKKHETLGWLKCGACLEKEEEEDEAHSRPSKQKN